MIKQITMAHCLDVIASRDARQYNALLTLEDELYKIASDVIGEGNTGYDEVMGMWQEARRGLR